MAKKSTAARRAPKRSKSAEANRPVAQHVETRGAALNPFEPMERLARAFMPFGWFMPWLEARTPKMDVIDEPGEIVVMAEVPGADKKAINVEVGDDSVTIQGSMHQESTEKRAAYYRAEISHGTFSRTVTLPGPVDGSKATADFKDGMLIIKLPKVKKPGGPLKVGRID